MFRLAKLGLEIELTGMKKSLLYSGNVCLNRRLREAKSRKKRSCHYQTYSATGLIALLIVINNSDKKNIIYNCQNRNAVSSQLQATGKSRVAGHSKLE